MNFHTERNKYILIHFGGPSRLKKLFLVLGKSQKDETGQRATCTRTTFEHASCSFQFAKQRHAQQKSANGTPKIVVSMYPWL